MIDWFGGVVYLNASPGLCVAFKVPRSWVWFAKYNNLTNTWKKVMHILSKTRSMGFLRTSYRQCFNFAMISAWKLSKSLNPCVFSFYTRVLSSTQVHDDSDKPYWEPFPRHPNTWWVGDWTSKYLLRRLLGVPNTYSPGIWRILDV